MAGSEQGVNHVPREICPSIEMGIKCVVLSENLKSSHELLSDLLYKSRTRICKHRK